MIAETKKEKANKLQEIRMFLKKQVKWNPPSKLLMPAEDMSRIYNGERYMVLSSRNENKPDVLESAIFVDDEDGYDAILRWNPDYKQVVCDLIDFSIIKECTRKVAPTLEDIYNEATIRKDAGSTSH